MDLGTVTAIVRPTTRGETSAWSAGDAWLAGGTWLFSEPQPAVSRLIDLPSLGWEPLAVTELGLEIASTCTLGELEAFSVPADWEAAALFRHCCRSLQASFKVLNVATVGGNVCMSLPAGAMTSLTAALEGVCTIWLRGGGERHVPVVDFVTGPQQNVLGPGDLLRSIELPVAALRRKSSFRRLSLTHLGRSTVLAIGTLCPRNGAFALTVTASTVRPVRLEFPRLPGSGELETRLRDAIQDDLYLDDVHGSPAYRKHLTLRFAEEIRRELSAVEAT